MKRTRLATILMLGVITTSTPTVTAQRVSAKGIVVQVGWQNSTLLFETPQGFSLVVVDAAAKIQDPLGVVRVLSDFQPGDVVEYRVESFKGIPIAQELRVISVSFGGTGPEEQRH